MWYESINNIDREVERIRSEEHCGPYSDDTQDDDPYGLSGDGPGEDGWEKEMKKYFVQQKGPDGEVTGCMVNAQGVIDMFGFRDCSGCEFEVYDIGKFGELEKLTHIPATSAPFNFHQFNRSNGKIAIAGFSPEH